MAGISELERKLADATDLFSRTTDPIERHYLGGDVRELEKLCQIAMGPDPEWLSHRRP